MADYLKMDGSNYEEFIASLPDKAKGVMERIEAVCSDGASYEELRNLLKEFEECGYTFDYYLDAEPFEFKKIGVEVSEEEFWGEN